MNATETGELLRIRRNLTGSTYNDEAIAAWQQALTGWTYEQCHDALIEATRANSRVTVFTIVEHLPARAHKPNSDRHSASCLCASRGWIEIEQSDERHTWTAWDRCPNGPVSAFYEID